MKKLLILAAALTGTALLAAETSLWDGSIKTVKAPDGVQVTAENGVLTAVGKSAAKGTSYGYLWPNVRITPTVMKGKKLSITIEPAAVQKGDTVYIKGRSAKGIVFSYQAALPAAEKKTYILTIGENSAPFKYLDFQVKAPADAPVTSLELIMGRRPNGSEMKISFSDIKLID